MLHAHARIASVGFVAIYCTCLTMPFGQLVIGPPGSGKTTYCHGLQQYCEATRRKVAIINLDPANDNLPYKPAVDISDLVNLKASLRFTSAPPPANSPDPMPPTGTATLGASRGCHG